MLDHDSAPQPPPAADTTVFGQPPPAPDPAAIVQPRRESAAGYERLPHGLQPSRGRVGGACEGGGRFASLYCRGDPSALGSVEAAACASGSADGAQPAALRPPATKAS